MHHLPQRSRILLVLIVLIVVGIALLALLLRGEPATGLVQPSEIEVITDDGSSLGQTTTLGDLMPAPTNETFQETPTAPDLQQQAPTTDLQEPGTIQ